MSRYWIVLRDKVDAFSMRERLIIFAASALILIAAGSELLLAPLQEKQKALISQSIQQDEHAKELQAQLSKVLQSRKDAANSPLHIRERELLGQMEEQVARLDESREHLVNPAKMSDLLGQLLQENGKVRLVEMKTLPVTLLLDKSKAESEAVQPASADMKMQIFRHGLQISVRGNYLDLMRYVHAMENIPTKMYWGEVSLDVEKHPDAVMTVILYTLSLDQTWLTI